MSTNKQYTKEMKKELGYVATWLPQTKIALGDVGTITNYEFKRITTLEQLEISFTTEQAPSQANLKYDSANAVSTTIKLAGKPTIPGSGLAEAEAGLHIKFSRENAITYRANGCSSTQISDLLTLGEKVKKKWRDGIWEDNWVVVTEVIVSESATIIISSGKNAGIDLQAKGNINTPSVNIASAEASLESKNESKIGFNVVAEKGLTTLFRASGVKIPLFNPTVFRGGGDDENAPGFVDMDYDTFSTEE